MLAARSCRRRSVRNIEDNTDNGTHCNDSFKAMDRSVAARDYTQQLAKILQNIAAVGGISHPLLESRPASEVLFLS